MNPNAPLYEELTFELERLMASSLFDSGLAALSKAELHHCIESSGIVATITTTLLSKTHVQPGSPLIYPDGWWQALKKALHLNHRTKSIPTEIRVTYMCPHIAPPPDTQGNHAHFRFMNQAPAADFRFSREHFTPKP